MIVRCDISVLLDDVIDNNVFERLCVLYCFGMLWLNEIDLVKFCFLFEVIGL